MMNKEILILLLCFLIGFALRFHTFDKKSLWVDEVHTFNDSRDNLKGQIKFYKENPSYLHPPLFFILTHQFYPFTRPERDLRIIPLIFGILSIPMIYLLARQFSSSIALPCALSLAFMTYHVSLSQDGRSYSLLMFLGMAGLYFFMKYLKRSKKGYLLLVALFFSVLFYTSYSSIPFIVLSQILWLYRPSAEVKRPTLASFLTLNSLILLLCLPWIIFLAANYKSQAIMDPFHTESSGSLGYILYGVLHDWVPYAPLMIVSAILLIVSPLLSKFRKNALVLLAIFGLPIAGLHFFCKILDITHFVTSRYFINFLPVFFITLYLSLEAVELKFETLKRFIRPKVLFIILFIASNLIVFPLYYRSEKQDFRHLVSYLKTNLRDGDKIFSAQLAYFPPILHYFGAYPETRHHVAPVRKTLGEIEHGKSFIYGNQKLTIYHSKICCTQYILDGSRVWIIVGKKDARELKASTPSVLRGYFDGSVLNLNRFPTDASMYLFLFDPRSPHGKGIDMSIE